MGHGIAYLLAAAGHEVGIFEPSDEVRASMPERLRPIVEFCSEDDPALIGRISAYDQLAPAVKDAAFVFEAAPEKPALKQKMFADSGGGRSRRTRCSPATVRPSDHRDRAHLKHRERVVGTHFWNPPHLVPLVEVIQAEHDAAMPSWSAPSISCATAGASRCT